jgi:hypothetical protein
MSYSKNTHNNLEILKSEGLDESEENFIVDSFLTSYKKYYSNFDQMDIELEELLNKKYEKKYVYTFYEDGKGAGFGCHTGKFLKFRYQGIIFKIWFVIE